MSNSIAALHVEATSRCTLACPKCERTILLDKFGKKKALKIQDLNIDNFEKFVDVKVDNITFCGNLGDPIYHTDFLRLVKVAKAAANSVTIVTNGSRKSSKWWNRLNSILGEQDTIMFSIDGTPENFTNYRVNGHWPSILKGITESVLGPATTSWKYIPFKFNENDIETVRELSKNLGVNQFFIDPSERWDINDPLKPDTHMHDSYYSKLEYKETNYREQTIDPLCKNNMEHYIGADGYYAPCCESRHYSFYYKSAWWKDKDKHAISNSKLSDQLLHFKNFYATIQDTRPDYCLFNCGKCEK